MSDYIQIGKPFVSEAVGECTREHHKPVLMSLQIVFGRSMDADRLLNKFPTIYES